MTSAKLHGVDTILLLFQDFQWPTDEFAECYVQHVEDVFTLTRYGISVRQAQDTLSWLRIVPSIYIPKKLSLATMDALAGKLISRRRGLFEFRAHHGIETQRVTSNKLSGKETPEAASIIGRSLTLPGLGKKQKAKHLLQDLSDPVAMPSCRVAVVMNPTDWEAVCAALLIKEMLVQHNLTSLDQVPFVLHEGDYLPSTVHVVLIICTNDCFHSATFVRQVLNADKRGVHFIPVVVVENFRFPVGGQLVQEKSDVAAAILAHGTQQILEDFARVVDTIFREIAISVVLQDGEEIIAVRIAAIASRVSDACDSPQGGKHSARMDGMQHTGRSKETTPREGKYLQDVSSERTRF